MPRSGRREWDWRQAAYALAERPLNASRAADGATTGVGVEVAEHLCRRGIDEHVARLVARVVSVKRVLWSGGPGSLIETIVSSGCAVAALNRWIS